MIEPVLTISPTVENNPWQWWRQRMPIANKWAYFDHAAVAPLPQPAADAIVDFARQATHEGDTRWPEWAAENERLRDDFAAWLHCKSSEIALIPNTSYGINVVAEGIPWQAGDNIVLPAGEFPSNQFPWLNQRRHDVEVRIVGDDGANQVDLPALLSAIDQRTRVVAASWVGYASGYRLDVARVADEVHRRGALFFLDAIQGLGAFPLNLEQTKVDFLAADGHKWLLGPEGAGVLMIRESHLADLTCVPVGWNSVRTAHSFGSATFELRNSASRYEIGSQTMVGMHALRQSLAIFHQIRAAHGTDAIGQRILQQADKLITGLRALGATIAGPLTNEHRSGIVTFAIPEVEAATIRKIALEQNVVVSCRGIGVRASVHAYNDDNDLDRLLGAVRFAMQLPPCSTTTSR